MYIRNKMMTILGMAGILVASNPMAALAAEVDTNTSVAVEAQEVENTEETEAFTMEKKYVSTTNVSNFGYWVYRPADSLDEELPLIVYMHGISERGNNLDKLLNVSLPMYLYNGEVSVHAVVIAPQCPSSTNWTNLADDVMELIHIVKEEENIDESSIGLTGHSLGGIGTWRIALKYPDVFSSLVPVSGTINNPSACASLKDIAIWAFHGSLDTMSPSSMLQAEKVITEAGGDKMQVTLFPSKGHCITDIVYNNPEYDVVNWMASQHRSDMVPAVTADTVPEVTITYEEGSVVSQRMNYLLGEKNAQSLLTTRFLSYVKKNKEPAN